MCWTPSHISGVVLAFDLSPILLASIFVNNLTLTDLFLFHFPHHIAPNFPHLLLLRHQWLQLDKVCRYPIIYKEKPMTIEKNAILKVQCILLRTADYLINPVALYVPLTPRLSIPVSQ